MRRLCDGDGDHSEPRAERIGESLALVVALDVAVHGIEERSVLCSLVQLAAKPDGDFDACEDSQDVFQIMTGEEVAIAAAAKRLELRCDEEDRRYGKSSAIDSSSRDCRIDSRVTMFSSTQKMLSTLAELQLDSVQTFLRG